MKQLQGALLVLAGLYLGQYLHTPAQAAPGDVYGSANVAVDTYRNSKGTYVLWADGRVTDAKGAANDMGHPYRDPDSSAEIGAPPHSQGKPQGSPNVAVKAIPRPDATYVLFSDGKLRKPNHADAAAAGSSGKKTVVGTFPGSTGGSQTPLPGYHLEGGMAGQGNHDIVLDEPMNNISLLIIPSPGTTGGGAGGPVIRSNFSDGNRVPMGGGTDHGGGIFLVFGD